MYYAQVNGSSYNVQQQYVSKKIGLEFYKVFKKRFTTIGLFEISNSWRKRFNKVLNAVLYVELVYSFVKNQIWH